MTLHPGVEDYFAGKPDSREVFSIVAERIEALGPTTVEVKSQVSYAVERKFAWFWLYNVTRKNPSGVLHLMLALTAMEEGDQAGHLGPNPSYLT